MVRTIVRGVRGETLFAESETLFAETETLFAESATPL